MSVRVLRQVVMVGAGIAVSMATFVTVMVYGFGVQPKEWACVLGLYPAGMVLSHVIVMLAGAEGKE